MIIRDYKIRVFIIFACFSTLFFIVVVRLFLIQVNQTAFFKKMARFQYEQERILYPPRASIYDRNGQILACSKPVWSAFLVPNQLKQSKKLKFFLTQEYSDVYQRLVNNKSRHFLWLERKLTSEKYRYLRELGIADIHFTQEYERYYPFASVSPVVGLTDIDNKGIAGLELEYTQKLSGVPSRVRLEKDARRRTFYFKKTIHEKGTRGRPVVTTLDASLQNIAYYELQRTIKQFDAQSGAVLILDPDTGDVLSMVNYPCLDPHDKHISDLGALKNHSVCECYELGSVMKIFPALAALEEGVVAFDEPIDCDRRITTIDGVKVENFTIALNKLLHEHDFIIPFHDVVCYSSNVGMAKVTKRLEAKLYDHLLRLGFGEKTGITFPGERDGFINHPKNWSKPSPIVRSFGYEMMISLLQLARAYCLIANGGYLLKPRLTLPTLVPFNKNQSVLCQSQVKPLYSSQSISCIKDMLEKIASRFSIAGFRTMGKTGTARCVKNGEYSDKHHNYTFAGIVEKGSYKRVVVTFVKEPDESERDKPLWASQVSAPLFKAVAEKMVVRDMTRGLVSF